MMGGAKTVKCLGVVLYSIPRALALKMEADGHSFAVRFVARVAIST